MNTDASPTPAVPLHFIHEIVREDIASNRNGAGGVVATRFPPEPNGYLHIGHAKSICLNFETALKYGGRCHLRMDDTNPTKEEHEYIDSIKEDVRWLGFDWGGHEYNASDYFQQLYDWAILFIKAGKAYVDDQSAEQISHTRGTLIAPGKESPFRGRSVEENLDLFTRMKKGEFGNGAKVLRAKIDMAHPNVTLRDPVMYRILHAQHPKTGSAWCIYPMYDYAHGQSDWIEGITHSLCTLEFEEHRPLYDWFVEQLMAMGAKPTCVADGKPVNHRPRQYEFARLNVTHMMMSKRRLLALVQEKIVTGWDDPRMPTICGLRRRGYTPASLREFCDRIGVARRDNTVEIALLEHCLRDDLNKIALRRMAVMKPVKLIIDNYPEGQVDELDAVNNPENASAGSRKVPFSRELYIEADDVRDLTPPKYFRLYPGNEVRLRYGYLVRCASVDKDASGNITIVHCTYDPATRGGNAPDNRKVKATIHWVSAQHAIDAEVRLYDNLFTKEDPSDVPEGGDWRMNINPQSLQVVTAKCEPSVADCKPGDKIQFERLAYFCCDKDSAPAPGKIVFNRTVALKDTWTRIEKKSERQASGERQA